MKSLTAGSNGMVGSAAARPLIMRKTLLICGIVSSLFYAGMDLIGGMRWESYSWISQEFSRLSAVGAPSRPLHLVLSPVYTLLVVAFGLGVWWSASGKRGLRVIGGSLVVYGLVSFVWPQFWVPPRSMRKCAIRNLLETLFFAHMP